MFEALQLISVRFLLYFSYDNFCALKYCVSTQGQFTTVPSLTCGWVVVLISLVRARNVNQFANGSDQTIPV